MEGKSVLKVPGGKLLKIFLDYDDKINKIKITGDFFLYPEESLEKLEEELIGLGLDKEVLLKKIDDFFKDNNVKLFGIKGSDIVDGVINCVKQ